MELATLLSLEYWMWKQLHHTHNGPNASLCVLAHWLSSYRDQIILTLMAKQREKCRTYYYSYAKLHYDLP